MTIRLPGSPWVDKSEHRKPLSFGAPQPDYSGRIYECGWDLVVHCTILSLLNAVAIVAINYFKKERVSIEHGIMNATCATVVHLTSVEGLNYYSGKNMRNGYKAFIFERMKALTLTCLLTPFIRYGYESLYRKHQVKFSPLLAMSAWNTLGLFSIPYL